MKAAKKRGKHVGRPKAFSPGQFQHVLELLAAGKTQREVAELLGVSANTVGRAIQVRKESFRKMPLFAGQTLDDVDHCR